MIAVNRGDKLADGRGDFMPASELDSLFDKFQRSAFRLEGLPEYDAPSLREEYRSYCEGAFLSEEKNSSWVARIRGWADSGKTVTRLRILPEPLTTYVKYELDWGYLYNAVAGEQIHLISEGFASSLVGEIPNDFWMFDNKRIADMRYNEDYLLLGTFLREDEEEVRKLAGIAETLLAKATPLQEYLRESRTKGLSHSLTSNPTVALRDNRPSGLRFGG